MTEKIKEALSIQFISILATHNGFNAQRPYSDYGVDLMIEALSSYRVKEKVRYFNSGVSLDLQVKCTTTERIRHSDAGIRFDLESKNYNDLIKRHPFRKPPKLYYIPLILVVFVLPEEPTKWINFTPEQLCMRGRAFWYFPEEEENLTLNRHSKRIWIPDHQQIDLNFFPNFFKLLHQ
jgi:hypothetical protein